MKETALNRVLSWSVGRIWQVDGGKIHFLHITCSKRVFGSTEVGQWVCRSGSSGNVAYVRIVTCELKTAREIIEARHFE